MCRKRELFCSIFRLLLDWQAGLALPPGRLLFVDAG